MYLVGLVLMFNFPTWYVLLVRPKFSTYRLDATLVLTF
eukprot:SAG31_NODE_924_length_10963_cov_4.339286_5_plen_38_part_00